MKLLCCGGATDRLSCTKSEGVDGAVMAPESEGVGGRLGDGGDNGSQ